MSQIPTPAAPIKPSDRKAAACGQLERLGLKVSGGHDYQLEDALLPGVTSTQAREALKTVLGRWPKRSLMSGSAPSAGALLVLTALTFQFIFQSLKLLLS